MPLFTNVYPYIFFPSSFLFPLSFTFPPFSLPFFKGIFSFKWHKLISRWCYAIYTIYSVPPPEWYSSIRAPAAELPIGKPIPFCFTAVFSYLREVHVYEPSSDLSHMLIFPTEAAVRLAPNSFLPPFRRRKRADRRRWRAAPQSNRRRCGRPGTAALTSPASPATDSSLPRFLYKYYILLYSLHVSDSAPWRRFGQCSLFYSPSFSF